MSVLAKNLTKRFGSFVALDNVNLEVPGGELLVRWDGPGTPVWLTGEAVTVFEGTVDI